MDNLAHTQHLIQGLKHPNDTADIPRIPIISNSKEQETIAYLRVVPSVRKGVAANDAKLMAEWRYFHRKAFFSWITPTEESTQKWHDNNYAENMTDIMFMVETLNEQPLGHLALYNFKNFKCEFGRVLQNPEYKKLIKGAMTHASFTLLHWAITVLHIKTVSLEVFAHNKKAISLYKRLGFAEKSTFFLSRTNRNGDIHWINFDQVSSDTASKENLLALKMEVSSEQLLKNYQKHHNVVFKGPI